MEETVVVRTHGDDEPTRASADGQGLTLLVADDDSDLRFYVERCVLGDGGAIRHVLQASDGHAALDLARSDRPDVLVSDVLMPGMDGIALCERLRADPATADIPILLLTGHATPNDTIRRARETGADALLLKPFNARRLCDAINDVLSARRSAGPSKSTPARRSPSESSKGD